MREILFRGKRLDNGEWVQGRNILTLILDQSEELEVYIAQSGAGYSADIDEAGNLLLTKGELYKVDPETVGQYTGLKDKNGTKIFEGDIVKRLFYFGLPVLSVVTFKNGAFGLEWNRGKVKEFSAFTSICNCTYEVIGNIYDNAELLGDI